MSQGQAEWKAVARRARGLIHHATGPALALASLLLLAFVAEAALRVFPAQLLPKGAYWAGRFDPDLGLSVAASTVYYKKGWFVRKEPNSQGFMDVEHELAKRPGTLRVGFFGDSYVEANQLPLEQTFFRLIPALLPDLPLEPFAFGVSGWGTLHAFLAYRYESPRYDLDRVVYLFVENDLADNSAHVVHRGGLFPVPRAESSAGFPGYSIHPGSGRGGERPWYALLKWFQQRSLLTQVLFSRFRLLRDEGVRVRVRAEDTHMSQRVHPKRDPAAIPSAWPALLRAEAERVGKAILADWKRETAAQEQDFSVLYVPRSEEQLDGRLPEEETWLPWLRGACGALSIRLIDPTDPLRRRMRDGVRVYDDHWSQEGSKVIARVLADDLRRGLAGPAD